MLLNINEVLSQLIILWTQLINYFIVSSYKVFILYLLYILSMYSPK